MNKKKKVYFIGIGGIGMSALAQWFLKEGWKVEGSDGAESITTQKLRKEGIKVKIGQKKGNLKGDYDLVVFGQAIRGENPEFQEAKEKEIEIKSYPEMIGELTRKYKTFSVSGAHGKSSSTAILAICLKKAGFDPTVIVGTLLSEFEGVGNFKSGKDGSFVLEADEFGKAFLNYSPFAAMITNIDREHLDTYKDLNDIKKTFLKFFKRVKKGGILVLNRDDKNLKSLAAKIKKITKTGEIKEVWYSLRSREAGKILKILKVKGRHNVSNATGVFKLLETLGIKEEKILEGIKKYRGCYRRFEFKGKYKGAEVFDDYAHHPTEIKATIEGALLTYKKITVVFQPHHQERLTSLFKEFTQAFKGVNNLGILETFKVAGREKKGKYKTAKELAEAIKGTSYLEDEKEVKKFLEEKTESGSAIIMMGAGNINLITDKLLKNKI